MFTRLHAQGILCCAFAVVLAGCATKGPATAGGGTPNAWPLRVQPIISSPYGDNRGRRHPHRGVDLQVPEGTPVHATANGIVSFSGEQRDYGNVIILDHGNRLSTAYAHLKKRRANTGDPVHQGQEIGTVGKTGNATTHHLHYEVRVDGQAVDPMRYLPPGR